MLEMIYSGCWFLWQEVRQEFQGESLFYYLPVFYGVGCLVYFTLPFEPRFLVSGILSLLGGGVFLLVRHSSLRAVGLLCLMALAGFFWAQVQTFDKDSQLLGRGLKEASLEGTVQFAEKRLRGSQFVLAVDDIKSLRPEKTPRRIRLYGKQNHVQLLQPGCHVTLRARLSPLSKPLLPNGYDQRFPNHFNKEGARGFIQDILKVDCSKRLSLPAQIERWRFELAAHLERHLSEQAKGIGIALVTGLRGQIPSANKNSLRASGLAHMLAISGLHMALMTGSIFAFLRLVSACFMRLNQTINLAPYCAALAVTSGFAYLLISGVNVATQRAFIMMSLVFLALMMGRYALTLRNVSIAAMIVLIIAPQSIKMVSFQMSFAAVLALVAFYEKFGRSYWQSKPIGRLSRFAYGWRRVRLYFLTLLLTSLIAGVVTGFIGAYHFNMFPVNGLTANLIAMPVFGVLIMPMALLGVFLSPVGWGQPFFIAMSWGIEFVIWVSDYTSNNGEAIFHIARSPPAALGLFAIGLICLCLWQGRLRLLAILPLLVSCLLLGRSKIPDVMVYGYAYQIAARQNNMADKYDDTYSVMSQNPNHYVLRQWARLVGSGENSNSAPQICHQPVCQMESAFGLIARVNKPEDLSSACADSVLVLVPFKVSLKMKLTLTETCKAKIFGRNTWRFEGGQALNFVPAHKDTNQESYWQKVSSPQTSRLWMY